MGLLPLVKLPLMAKGSRSLFLIPERTQLTCFGSHNLLIAPGFVPTAQLDFNTSLGLRSSETKIP